MRGSERRPGSAGQKGSGRRVGGGGGRGARRGRVRRGGEGRPGSAGEKVSERRFGHGCVPAAQRRRARGYFCASRSTSASTLPRRAERERCRRMLLGGHRLSWGRL